MAIAYPGVQARAVGLEVPHDQNLLFQRSGGGGDHGGADLLRAVVEPQAAREQAVGEGHLDHVVLGHAPRGKDARHALGPDPYVISRIADHDGASRGAGGGLDAHDVAQGNANMPYG